MKIAVYCSASEGLDPALYTAAESFGRALAARGHSLVYGGFGKGIMGAVARGVRAGGGQVIGVIPAVFAGRDDNFACDRAVYTQTMHQRKAAMEAEADAFAILPGGVGTYDEFFEVLVLCTLGELSKPLAVFNPDGCFDALAALRADGAARGLISRRTVSLAPFFAAPEPLLAHLEQQAAQQ